MKQFVKLLAVSLGFGLFGLVMSLVPQKAAHGTVAAQVDVVNTPLPVTGNLNATIVGTPTVNVASAPPVNVNFPSSIGINGAVTVQNAPGFLEPIPLVVRQETHNFLSLSFNTFTGVYQLVLQDGSLASFGIPSGWQLIITDVSWFAGCTPSIGCVLSLGDEVNLELGNFYLSGETYKQAIGGQLFAARTDHLSTGFAVTQVPTPVLIPVGTPHILGDLQAVFLQGYLAPPLH